MASPGGGVLKALFNKRLAQQTADAAAAAAPDVAAVVPPASIVGVPPAPPGAPPTVSQVQAPPAAAPGVSPYAPPTAVPPTPSAQPGAAQGPSGGGAPPTPTPPEVTGGAPPAPGVPLQGEVLPGEKLAAGVESGRVAARPVPPRPASDPSNYNFDQLATTEDVQKLIAETAEVNRPQGKKFQGVAATEKLAADIHFEDLTGTQASRSRSAEEVTAAAQIMITIGGQIDAISKWMVENPGEVGVVHEFKLRTLANKMVAVESVMSDALNEAGRVLRMSQVVKQARGSSQYLDTVKQAMASWGENGALNFAKSIQIASVVQPGQIAEFIAKNPTATPAQAVQAIRAKNITKATQLAVLPTFQSMWIAAYRNALYTFRSHARNLTSSVAQVFVLDPADKFFAGLAGSIRRTVRGQKGGAYIGEAGMRYLSMAGQLNSAFRTLKYVGVKDTLANVKNAAKGVAHHGASLKMENHDGSLFNSATVKALADPTRTDTWKLTKAFGRAASKLPNGFVDGVGTVIHFNENLLGTVDDMMMASHYEAEMFALAYRQAMDEGAPSALARVDQILSSPKPGMMDAALKKAQTLQFTNPQEDDIIGFVANGAKTMKARYPTFGAWLVPFVNTPANLMRWTVARTPILGFVLKPARAALLRGGAEADEVIGRMMLGGTIMGVSSWMYLDGRITGSPNVSDEVKARVTAANVPKNSYISEDGSFSVSIQSTVDPVGMMMLTGATMTSMVGNAPDRQSYTEIATGYALAAGGILKDQSMMVGVSHLVEALSYDSGITVANSLVKSGIDFVIYPLAGLSAAGTFRQIVQGYTGTKPIITERRWLEMDPAEQAKYEYIRADIVPDNARTKQIYAVPQTADMDNIRISILDAQKTWPGLNSEIAFPVDKWGEPILNVMNVIEQLASPANVEEIKQLEPRDRLMFMSGIPPKPPPTGEFDYTMDNGEKVHVNLAHFDYDGKNSITNPGWAITRFQQAIGRGRAATVDRLATEYLEGLTGVDSKMSDLIKKSINDSDNFETIKFMRQKTIADQLSAEVTAMAGGPSQRDVISGKVKPKVPPMRAKEFPPTFGAQ